LLSVSRVPRLEQRSLAWERSSSCGYFYGDRMKKIPKVEYQTPEQLAERIRERELEAELLPPGAARQSVLIEVAQLRAYADVKRWLASGT
jgi:hypothetical protein